MPGLILSKVYFASVCLSGYCVHMLVVGTLRGTGGTYVGGAFLCMWRPEGGTVFFGAGVTGGLANGLATRVLGSELGSSKCSELPGHLSTRLRLLSLG